MTKVIRIGTRESQLAVWQARRVEQLFEQHGYTTEIIGIKSEGDLDLTTPLYELGVQGVFTRSLDAALLDHRCDVAVHSMKDVPTVPARGLAGAAVLPRGPVQDILVYRENTNFLRDPAGKATIATGSVRRRAQWLNRFPDHQVVDLRGNVNTRLRKLEENAWDGAIFAAAGLERIGLRPENSQDLDWMLPAPAQGAILVVCREEDTGVRQAAALFNEPETALCTGIERDFLRTLLGGCSTPISALARVEGDEVVFAGNILSPDGRKKAEVTKRTAVSGARDLGASAAAELLSHGGDEIRALLKTLEKNG